jgi:PAS domain-containing protein
MPGSEELSRTTLDHLLQGFQIIAPDWTYLYVNRAAAEQGRTTPDKLEGRTMWEAYPGIEQTPLFEVLKEVMGRSHASLRSMEGPCARRARSAAAPRSR